jgi:uncharacterized membrane protein
VLVIFVRHKPIIASFHKYWKAYLGLEIVFILLFAIGVLIRSSLPKIEGVEKFMDSAILSNLLRHSRGAPVDTWYAPDPINYYYFGHWIVATVAKLSSTTIGYAFNLGYITFLAVAGSSIFGLGWQLSKKMVGGLLALFFALFAANLHPIISLISGTNNYYFFNSGRFVEHIINEYPFYSIVLGDLHAHMLSLIVTTTIYLSILLVLFEKKQKNKTVFAIIAGLLTGVVAATNSFDVITSFLLFGLVLLWMAKKQALALDKVLYIAGSFVAMFLVILGVFLTHFEAAVSGIALTGLPVPLLHIFWQFGAFLILIAISLYFMTSKILTNYKQEIAFSFLMLTTGLILIVIPEFVIFKDIYFYKNPSFASANTVFKLWYAAWPLLAISSASLAIIAIKISKLKKLVIIILIILCSSLLVGTYVGVKSIKDPRPNTLNGLNYLSYENPSKLLVIEWVNKNIQDQPIILQADGESYTNQSWLSSYSGTASIIGWRSHEWGWRYSDEQWTKIEKRSAKIQQIYESINTSELTQQTKQANVSYILIGPDENTQYRINTDLFMQAFGSPVYQNGEYKIFKT